MRRFISVLAALFITINIYSVNYMTTAESISWNGAYTSVADGFESMLYNPAGLYMSNSKFGLNLFGSYGVRIYNNVFSSGDITDLLGILTSNNPDITDYISRKLNNMPDFGLDVGGDVSMLNFMMYMKFKKFSLGISMVPKTNFTATIGKDLFSTIFQNLSLSDPIDIKMNLFMLQYLDFNFSLSTRAGFLEKHIPVEAIYVGLSSHFYLPTAYLNMVGSARLSTGSAGSNGFYNYDLALTGTVDMSTNYAVSFALMQIPMLSQMGLDSLMNMSGTFGFGLGWDVGFIIKFNKYIRYGFAATDLGFLVFPESAGKYMSLTTSVNPLEIAQFGTTFAGQLRQELLSSYQKNSVAKWFMPGAALRTGIGITPIHHKNLDLIIAIDMSLTDMNRMINGGYPTFNFAAGLEFNPRTKIVEFPLRLAFNYNSQVNMPSFSVGAGLYIGPVEMELAVKGLEFLIKGWGAKEIVVGADFKLEF